MSHGIPIEKISANTEFKVSFTSPSIEELASSFRMDSHQSKPQQHQVKEFLADTIEIR